MKKCNSDKLCFEGSKAGEEAHRPGGERSRSGLLFCPFPVAGRWLAPLLELEMRKEVAFVQPWSLSDAFVTNPWGPCACHALTHVSGAGHPTVLPVSWAASAAGENIFFFPSLGKI